MTATGPDIVHGAQIPTPRWWRRYRDIPLIILAILSLAAALVGWVTQYRIDAAGGAPAVPTPTPSAIDAATAAACRPEIPAPEVQPWIDGDGSADMRIIVNGDREAHTGWDL